MNKELILRGNPSGLPRIDDITDRRQAGSEPGQESHPVNQIISYTINAGQNNTICK